MISYGPSRRKPYLAWYPRQAPTVVSQPGQIFTQTVDDTLDLLDDYIRNQNSLMDESSSVQDAVLKSFAKVVDDSQYLDESMAKNLAMVLADSLDIVDAANLFRYLSVAFAESVDIMDAYAKVQGSNIDDSTLTADAFIKSVAKVLDDFTDIVDTVTITKFLALVLAEFLDVMDDFIRSRTSNLDDTASNEDGIIKTIGKVIAEQQDISDDFDISKVLALILLQLSDLLDVADEFVKTMSSVQSDDAGYEDAFIKTLSQVTSDSVDFSDVISVNKSLSLVVSDLQEVLDGLTKIQDSTVDDPAISSDEFTKTVVKVATELLDARDELDKIHGIILPDNADLSDTVNLLRTLSVLVSDAVDILDETLKNRTANLDDQPDAVDTLTKILLNNLQDTIDAFDQAVVSKFISLVLSEIQDVADDIVKSMSIVMADDQVNQDALVKLIAKVIAEEQSVSDDLTATVIRAIIIIAEYLDTRLSGQHDLMRRIGGVNDLMKRVSKVLSLLPRKPGTRGHVR